MKTDFQTKFLQHLLNKKDNAGFTLIELLVVIIIIGILSAIALPSFLNQANKAKQSEAKTYVGSMNRAQQAYYLEQNKFATDASDFGKLGLGVATQTGNYKYSVAEKSKEKPTAVVNLANSVVATAPLKAYAGAVSVGTLTTTSEATTLASLCESDKAMSATGSVVASAAVVEVTEGAAPTCKATEYTIIK
jgi:type IV pilus assembly protein PilA